LPHIKIVLKFIFMDILNTLDEIEESIKEIQEADGEDRITDDQHRLIDLVISRLGEVNRQARKLIDEIDEIKGNDDEAERKIDSLEGEIEEYEQTKQFSPRHHNLYDIQKIEIVNRLYENLNLEQLQSLEEEVKVKHKDYNEFVGMQE
jgi:uncharacterized phage infection (PIP) family protein YhgE